MVFTFMHPVNCSNNFFSSGNYVKAVSRIRYKYRTEVMFHFRNTPYIHTAHCENGSALV